MLLRVYLARLVVPMLLVCSAAAFAAAPDEPVHTPVAAAGAMQEKDFTRAIAALDDALPQAKGEQREYLTYLKGLAQYHASDYTASVATLAPFRDTWAASRWAAKAQFRMAAAYLAAKDFAPAAEIYEQQVSYLVSPQRQDAIADLYLRLADELIHPEDKDVEPDYGRAHELAAKALDLALSAEGMARVLARMGRIWQLGKQWDRAIEDYDRYLKETEGPERLQVRLWRGECLLARGNDEAARNAWQDLGRDLPGAVEGASADERRQLRALQAELAYLLPQAYGIPAPDNDRALNLGVEALRSALASFPDHKRAVQAAYDIAASYLGHGRDEEAVKALKAFLAGEGFEAKGDKAKETLRTLTMRATYQLGLVYQRQKKYEQAIETWQTYAEKYPDGPDWAESQQRIIGMEYQIGHDLLAEKRHAEARESFERFLAKHPLDSRAPAAMYGVGQALAAQEKHAQAIEAWRRLVSKFPQSEAASNAQFSIAQTYETALEDPGAAIEEYKKCTWGPRSGPARQAIARMKAKHLEVIAERVFRTNELATVHVNVRNIKALTLRAYRLDLAAYFRSKQRITGIEALDINLVDPTESWEVRVDGYADHLPISRDVPLPFDEPGVYAVTVTDGEDLEATALVIRSDLDIIVKTSRTETFVFAQNMLANRGWPGVEVLVSDGGKVFFEGKTGEDGVFRQKLDELRTAGATSVFASADGHCASNLLELEGLQMSQALSARAYVYTDRPAYRPGQTVQVRGIVREIVDGHYGFTRDAAYQFEVIDPRGRVLLSRPVALGEFGAFTERFSLDPQAPAGGYRLAVYQHGGSRFTGGFRVEPYMLQRIALEIEVPRRIVYRGERIEGMIVATYHYGEPVVGSKIEYVLPDGRHFTGHTDAKGRLAFSLDTRGFIEDSPLTITARVAEEGVTARQTVYVAVLGLRLAVSTPRSVYLSGEQFPVNIHASDPFGEALAARLNLRVLRRTQADERWGEVEVERRSLKTDSEGQAAVTLRLEKGGQYLLRAWGTDQFGHTVTAQAGVRISDQDDPTKLLLLTDLNEFKVGSSGEVNLHSRVDEALALITFEGEAIIRYRLVTLKAGGNAIMFDVGEEHFPNFALSAAVMHGNKFYTASREFSVRQALTLTLRPVKERFAPGESVTVDITAHDHDGKPVRAELSLAAVDQALLALFGDPLPPLAGYFAAGRREARMRTDTSCTFRYAARTMPVVTEVLAEGERLARLEQAESAREEVVERARMQVAHMQAGGIRGGGVPGPPGRVLGEMDEPADGAMDWGLRADGIAGVPLDAWAVRRSAAARVPLVPGEPTPPTPAPRERFPETAYWNGSIVTDTEGKARVTFTAPDTMTAWQMLARGITSGTLAGDADETFTVAKDFFVELRLPPVLMAEDKVRVLAQVHTAAELKGEASLTLETRFGDQRATLTRRLQVGGPGVWEAVFDAATVPPVEQAVFSLSAAMAGASDRVERTVPIAPWGIEFAASKSGLAAGDRTISVALPAGREYSGLGMRIVLGPSLDCALVDLALETVPEPRFDLLPPTRADSASQLLGIVACMDYLKRTAEEGGPEGRQLLARAEGLVADLAATQGEDGGWCWAGSRESDRYTSSLALWALSLARERGIPVAEETVDRAVAYLADQFARADLADSEGKAVMLHALAQQNKAEFEFAHRLYRMRDQISEGALALLALAFVEMERKEIAGEVLDTLLSRAREAPLDGETGVMWSGARNQPWLRSDVETTALAILAAEQARPETPQLKQAMSWLMAQRRGAGWQPAKARGPALAAACGYYAGAESAGERYRLDVRVNDTEVKMLEVTGASATTVIDVPRGLLRSGDNRVDFRMEGRGQYAYAATLTGVSEIFDVNGAALFKVDERRYEPPAPYYEGRPIQVGFQVARDYQYFRNEVKQLPAGSLARVTLPFYHRGPSSQPADDDFLVIEESIPAGATVVEGSVSGAFSHFTLVDGGIIFYTRASRKGGIRYDLYGFTPGEYRVLPTVLRSAYSSEVLSVNRAAAFTVLARDEKSTDNYRPTPGELYYHGKALFDDGRLDEAQPLLARLYEEWTLRDNPLRETARMLFYIAVAQQKHAEVVKYFELLRERYPNAVIPFDKMLAVAQAYRQEGEQERAGQVFAAIADASFLRDAAVPGVIEEQGRFLESVDHMLDVWRAYPDTPTTESAYFAVSQALYQKALKPDELPKLRKGLTKQEVLLRTIGIINRFLTLFPDNPIADEASFSLANAFLELEDHESVVQLAQRFHSLYPKSTYADDFRYVEAVGEFWLGRHEQALKVAMEVAESKTLDAYGVERESKNKWLALYIAAQIYHATRRPSEAVEHYTLVADRYPEASEAADYFAKQTLTMPELTIVPPGDAAKVTLDYRNLKEAEVRVYRVDLMRLYLTRRSLAEAARIDLAGVSPLHAATIALNENTGAQPEKKELALQVSEEGAYLVLARSGNIYASGLLLITPLALDVQEEADAGRLRVNVRESKSGDFLAKVHVKVIGSGSGRFVSGETDLRGVFIADGLRGTATAIARGEGDRYAFFRGETWLGPPAEVPETDVEAAERQRRQITRGAYLENLGARNVQQQEMRTKELRALYEKGKGLGGIGGGMAAGSAR